MREEIMLFTPVFWKVPVIIHTQGTLRYTKTDYQTASKLYAFSATNGNDLLGAQGPHQGSGICISIPRAWRIAMNIEAHSLE